MMLSFWIYSRDFIFTVIKIFIVRNYCQGLYFASVWSRDFTQKIKSSQTRHVIVKHGCPRRQQSQNMAKIPIPQGHGTSMKCEEPIDKLTIQVWLLSHHPNFKYCTLFVSGTELRMDGQTNGWTDRRMEMPPADLSGRGHNKKYFIVINMKYFPVISYLNPIDILPHMSSGIVRVDPFLAVGFKVLVFLRFLRAHGYAGNVEVGPVGVI